MARELPCFQPQQHHPLQHHPLQHHAQAMLTMGDPLRGLQSMLPLQSTPTQQPAQQPAPFDGFNSSWIYGLDGLDWLDGLDGLYGKGGKVGMEEQVS